MKQFIIIGNNNACTCKEIFPHIKYGEMWLGVNNNKTLKYEIPEHYEKYDTIVDGKKYGKVPSCSWFTNVKHETTGKPVILTKSYYENPDYYPKYDNYDAINVDRIKDIPYDYDGVMGVPITFLDKYYNGEFLYEVEIEGATNCVKNFTPNKEYINPVMIKNGKICNARNAVNGVTTIKSETKPDTKVYYTADNAPYLTTPYTRLLIKKKLDFEIIWISNGSNYKDIMPYDVKDLLKPDFELKDINGKKYNPIINSISVYARVFIKIVEDKTKP